MIHNIYFRKTKDFTRYGIQKKKVDLFQKEYI